MYSISKTKIDSAIGISLLLVIGYALTFTIVGFTVNLNKSIDDISSTKIDYIHREKENKNIIGEASYYDYDYPQGSGNWITEKRLVAASRDYPRGSILRVCSNDEFNFCVVVKVTDYGPELSTGRIIDMGSFAFSRICRLSYGVCQVNIEKVQ